MNIKFYRAGLRDLDLLVQTRIEVLYAANRLNNDVDMSEVERESRRYYQTALSNNMHTAYLAFDGDRIVGAGGISYYEVMPTYHNPSGRKAYVMNMYTAPEYRRKGIAIKTLELLIRDALERGIKEISLEATEMGKPLYKKFGFVPMRHEMELTSVWWEGQE